MPPISKLSGKTVVSAFDMIAVPMFFMITGYFLFSPRADDVARRALRSALKILPAIVILNLIYLIPHLLRGNNPVPTLRAFVLGLIEGFYIEGALWYLTALCNALFVIYALCRLGAYRYLRGLLLLIPMALLIGRYSFVLGWDAPLIHEFQFVSLGLPYIILGYTLRSLEERLLPLPWEVITFVVFILGALELMYFRDYLSAYQGRYLFTPLLASSIFMWSLQYKSWGAGTFTARLGKYYAGNIYYWHMLVAMCLRVVIRTLGWDVFYDDLAVFYVFPLSFLVSYVVVKLQKRFGVNYLP